MVKVKKPATKKTKKAQTKEKIHVAIILDSSGSMYSVRQATINSFNEQVQTLRKNLETKDISVTLVTFSDETSFRFVEKPVASLKEIGEVDYVPCGSTALYDAIGQTMDRIEQIETLDDGNSSVLFVILTDGEENASKVYTHSQISERIKAHQEKNWTFTYIGANHDVMKVSINLNIPLGNTMSYSSTHEGFASMSSAHRGMVDTFLKTKAVGASSTSLYSTENKVTDLTNTDKDN